MDCKSASPFLGDYGDWNESYRKRKKRDSFKKRKGARVP